MFAFVKSTNTFFFLAGNAFTATFIKLTLHTEESFKLNRFLRTILFTDLPY